MMEYRGDFIFFSFLSTLWTIFNFFFFSLIFNVSDTIAGWSADEMYLLLGTFTMLDAFTWTFFYHNMSSYTRHVFTGSLSMLLTKPISTIFLLTTAKNSYNNIFRFFIGCFTVYHYTKKLGVQPSVWDITLYCLLIFASLLLIYAVWFITATFAFWIEKLDNINEIIPGLRRVMQVPKGVFVGASSLLFTVVLPFGLVSSVPSEVLLQRADVPSIIWLLLSSVIAVVGAIKFFTFAIKKYSSVGN